MTTLKDMRSHDKRVITWALNHCRDEYDALIMRQIKALHADLQELALRLEFADSKDADTVWMAVGFVDCFIDD